MTVQTKNLVLSGTLDGEYDLDIVVDDLPVDATSYEPDKFPAIVYRFANRSASVLLFTSGKIICTGVDEENAGIQAIDDFLGILEGDIERPPLEIQNLVCNASLFEDDRQLNLPAVVVALGLENAEYEPEQFPACIYKIDDPSAAFLIFTSGSVVITGTTTITEAEEAFDILQDKLDNFGFLD